MTQRPHSQRGGHEFEPRAVHQQNHDFPNNSADCAPCTSARAVSHGPRQPLRSSLFALVLLTVAFGLLPVHSHAQSLTPARLYLAAAAADWTTTGYLFARQPFAAEGNPMYGWTMDQSRIAAGERATPGQVAAVLAMSAGVDVLSTWAVQRWIAPKHPKVARALLIVGVGVRSHQATKNLRLAHR